jgi:hypothetical protein
VVRGAPRGAAAGGGGVGECHAPGDEKQKQLGEMAWPGEAEEEANYKE